MLYSGSKFRGSGFKVRLMKDVYEQASRIPRGGTAFREFTGLPCET
ncbi:MAG: hypothetical protein JRJ06_07455 [Deltaproteobacteria bacterium]|nr:hypothetical protein [Deltaproteobacteria bacterium]MBW1912077.1 hypothetical protein [Deltaproteobacteria bacterium]